MSLYEIIVSQLKNAGFDYEEKQLQTMDIIEYMVLESAGVLKPLEGKALKCVFRAGYTSNIWFQDEKARSSLELGLKDIVWDMNTMSTDICFDFFQIVHVIEDKFPKSTFDNEHYYYNIFETFYAVIMLDQDFEHAIKTSSLYTAAGDLAQYDVQSLLLLEKKLNLYKIADENLSALTDNLLKRVNIHISNHFSSSQIEEALPHADKAFNNMLAIAKEEKRFNQLLHKLRNTLNKLVTKGSEFYEYNIPEKYTTLNKKFVSNYSNVAQIAKKLNSSLNSARIHFFNNPMSQKSFEQFKETCSEAIKSSKDEFAKFRGQAKWYSELHPILQSILTCIKVIGGILAGITVIPAVLTEIYTEQGYIGTFFNTKPNSLRKLEAFEQGLCTEENGVFSELNKVIPT